MTLGEDLLVRAYDAFNRRDIDAALALMHPDVEWPHGIDGGYLHGHAEVRDYWMRQWTEIDPHVEPVQFETDASGGTMVTVHQVVRDRTGTVLADRVVAHVYRFEGGLVRSMEIRQL